MINFAAHEVRAGEGAWADFETMLGLLVTATEKSQANLVFANPGDWGIDVLVGRLDREVDVWQAKYFRRGVGNSQRRSIESSFGSARTNAQRHGYRLRRWVLCVPCSLDAPTTQWWASFRERNSSTGTLIELWDENRLRELLLLDSAVHIRRAYYDPYQASPRPASVAPVGTGAVRTAPTPPDSSWQAGQERVLGAQRYLLHEHPRRTRTPDGSLTRNEVSATLRDGRLVWIRQAQALRPTPTAAAARQGLRVQASLDLLHPVVELIDDATTTTLVTALPPGTDWDHTFGAVAVSEFLVPAVIAAGVDVCDDLERLHRRGYDHRRLDGTQILVGQDGARLRDAGLMATAAAAADAASASTRAPEQALAPYTAGSATDVYLLAALVQRTLTGHLPRPGIPIPLPVFVPGFPTAAAATVETALSALPAQRPGIPDLREALGQALSAISGIPHR